MRASKNTAFRNGFCALLLRTDESARVYAPAERCYCYYYYYYYYYYYGSWTLRVMVVPAGHQEHHSREHIARNQGS